MTAAGEILALPDDTTKCALEDRSMPWIAEALDRRTAGEELSRAISVGGERIAAVKVVSAACIRHKPTRRCLIEYGLEVLLNGEWRQETLIGKIRAKGVDTRTFELMETLRRLGFNENAHDGIAVPEPVGVVHRFQMWLSRKCAGVPAGELIGGSGGEAVGMRMADAAWKVHQAGAVPGRHHTPVDELLILHAQLKTTWTRWPSLERRLRAILKGLERLGPVIAMGSVCGIHRDFYQGQVLVDGPKTWLLDFDLFSEGDPAVDIGNALAHLTEQALREEGDPCSLDHVKAALLGRYMQSASDTLETRIKAYETLSFARLVAISDAIPARRHLTAVMIDLCEQEIRRLN